MMKTVLHRAGTRGHADHGWLDSYHTFSFGKYYDPMRIHFGALRVLNDDVVEGGKGFGRHPHDNMEIISIPLYGDLEHQDSMNNVAVIRQNDVQIMSAGTGIHHSEYNKNPDKKVNFLQIWVLPKERNVKPNYDQRTFPPEERVDRLQLIAAPDNSNGNVRINQDAWLYLGNLRQGFKTEYVLNLPGNGIYAFLIDGQVSIEEHELHRRDGLGIWDTDKITIEANRDSELLLMEVPMNYNG